MLWERGGRFSQRHAETGSSQLAAGEVTAALLGGCAHSKRPGGGARPLLPGPERRENHLDSTEKVFNEPWSSRSQAPPAQSFNKYSAKRSGGLVGRQRVGAVTMHKTPRGALRPYHTRASRTAHGNTSIFLCTREREHTHDLCRHGNTRLHMRRPTLQHWPGPWRLRRPLLALRSGTGGLSPAELGGSRG